MNRILRYHAAVGTKSFVSRNPRAGLSLLEVLVACGILVIGLSSIAAILPAAGSRFAQATQADRAGVTAANAYADLVNRRLLSADLFSTPSKACVFGKELREVPDVSAAARAVTEIAKSNELNARIDPTTGFLLQDELVYRPPTTTQTPLNAFVSGTTSIRQYTEGACWGAMIASRTAAGVGTPATLSIAVFKKEGGPPVQALLAGPAGSTLLQYSTGAANGLADEATRKRYLPGCSFVLALTNPPQWIRITSSWTNPGPVNPVTQVEDASKRASFVVLERNPFNSGSTMPFVAFENLMRVDHYPVRLD